jgi:TM2 domain-containing membrane protein YozV
MAKRKSPAIAAGLSLLIAGLGQLYTGKFLRGTIFILLEIVTSAVFFWIHTETGLVLNVAVSLIAAYDAYKLAAKINRNPPEIEKDSNEETPEIYVE